MIVRTHLAYCSVLGELLRVESQSVLAGKSWAHTQCCTPLREPSALPDTPTTTHCQPRVIPSLNVTWILLNHQLTTGKWVARLVIDE